MEKKSSSKMYGKLPSETEHKLMRLGRILHKKWKDKTAYALPKDMFDDMSFSEQDAVKRGFFVASVGIQGEVSKDECSMNFNNMLAELPTI